MDISTMQAIKTTLESVTCSGSENWTKLIGCIQVLDREIKKELEERKGKEG